MPRRPRPWYRRARRSWFVTIAGVQHNLGPDKSEAFDSYHQLMRQPQRRRVSPESLAAVADAFLDWTQRNRAPATYDWYRERLEGFVREHRDLPVDLLRPHHVETWAAAGRRSVNTRRNLMRAVKRCLKWAHTQGYIETNPIARLEIPGAVAKDVYIPPHEFAELLALANGMPITDLLVVTYETGCRPQELLRVEARHVDLERCRWVFPAAESKMKAMPRVVYLNDRARRITERALETRPEGPLFRNAAGRPWNKDSVACALDRLRVQRGREIMRRRKEAIADSAVAREVQALNRWRILKGERVAKSAAELRSEARRKLEQRRARQLAPSVSLYALRHSWATNALRRGVDALTVAILMGHRDPSTLARTYQHLSHNPEHLLEQARRAVG